MLSPRATIGVFVALTLTVGGAAACSSSKSSSSGGTGGGSGSAGGGSAQAAANIEPLLKAPTSINITQQLKAKPPTGKKIAITQSSEPVTLETNKGFADAAAAVGWTVSVVPEGTGPEDPGKALGQAIDQHPDAIFVSGQTLSTMRTQIERAKAEKIPVFQSDSGEPVSQDGSIYVLSLDSFQQTGAWGKMIADYIATKGSKHTLVVDLSLYPILHAFSEGVVNELKSVSPSTKTTLQDTQITDLIGGKIPSQVVSAIQRNPDIDWVILCLGDMATGLKAALRGAGFGNKVKIGGESASTANITALKKKDEDVWTGFAAKIHGWRRIDAAARVFNGESLDPNNNSLLPTQLITQDNVNSAPLDTDGYYLGVPDYKDQYLKLWMMSS
jgi:ABC-type sugar transport system substrate-binding protein